MVHSEALFKVHNACNTMDVSEKNLLKGGN